MKIINKYSDKCSMGSDVVKGEIHDTGNSTRMTEKAESGNETNNAHDIAIELSKSRTLINKNKCDNSDVVKSGNHNINEIPDCFKTVSEQRKAKNEDSASHENCESYYQERCRNEINNDNSEISVKLREIKRQSIKNGDIVKSPNKSIKYVRQCSEIITQQIESGNETNNQGEHMSKHSKGGNQGNNDVDKYEIVTEAVKSGKESKSDNQENSEIVNKKLDSVW